MNVAIRAQIRRERGRQGWEEQNEIYGIAKSDLCFV